jgi:hypothetical protein
MRKSKLKWVVTFAAAAMLFAAATLVHAAPQSSSTTNFVGTWQIEMQHGGPGGPGGGQAGNGDNGGNGGGQGDNGGGNGGGHGRRGMGPSSLVITQDGDNYKVVHKTQRGDTTSSATASGNSLTWTEERQGRDGNAMKIQFKATVDGDTMKGTLGGGQFTRDFTAKRGAS